MFCNIELTNDKAIKKYMSSNNQSSIVSKCTKILDILAEGQRALRFADIVEKSGFVKSSTHRVLAILVGEGLAEYDERNKAYRLGPKLMNWAVSAWRGSDLHQAALVELEELCNATGHNVALAIRDRTSALFLCTFNSYVLRYTEKAGEHAPLHCTAVGKVLIAFLPASQRKKLIEELPLEKFTEHTIVDRLKLEQEIETVREQGYALAEREEFLKVCGIATPVFDFHADVVGSICIWSSDNQADSSAIQSFLPQLCTASENVSNRLGYYSS